MKNQNVGNVEDFAKLGLLRFLDARGLTTGINWYLTKDDRTSPARLTKYLKDSLTGAYDRELFYVLRRIVSTGTKDVRLIDAYGVVPHATCFAEPVPTGDATKARQALRKEWFERSLRALEECDLILADADAGLAPQSVSAESSKSESYVLPEEVMAYYGHGHDVIYHIRRGGRKGEAWEREKTRMRSHLPDARILELTSHKGIQRTYVFVVHADALERYERLLSALMASPWHGMFSRDGVRKGDPTLEQVGQTIELETSFGYTISLYRNGLGRLCAKRDDRPGETRILEPDYVARHLFHY